MNIAFRFTISQQKIPQRHETIQAEAGGIKTVDFLVEGIDREKSAMIITEHEQEATEVFSQNMDS